ncbi:alpha/beta fold hydrolase [Kineosporia sp. NBRC 101677]|uniref:alpha/beta fold hydrolase n=1 Tax=Kineosporia sp. NBRC 101677 TaxID=3032197 RepID=UPI002554A053|nr:alpha/beta fold hydrolase [Kineosporia sp. NBRC 101677]
MSVVGVLGTTMYLRDTGAGRPVLFLHGNPTSSHLWRHVIAGRRPGWRCLAPDLIGMGRSARPYLSYSFADHVAHLEELLLTLERPEGSAQDEKDEKDEKGGLDGLVVVGHDRGVALGLDLLRRRRRRDMGQVTAIAVMEGHIRPLPGWEAFDPGGRELFQRMRTPQVGEQMVLHDNFFLDTLLPAALQRALTEDELHEYRRHYPDPHSRRALLDWARQIPVAGVPAPTHAALEAAAVNATRSPVPKLLITAPGTPIVTPEVTDWCTRHLPNLTVTDVGEPAGHFLPEDRPKAVTDVLWQWLETLEPPGSAR